MFKLLAHAGETHSEDLETIAHYVAPWYFAIPVFLLILAGIGYVTWIVSGKNTGTVLMTLAVIMLVCGMTMFAISPAVSIISILGGMLLSGLLAITGLSK